MTPPSLLTLGPAGPGSPLAPSRPLKPWGAGERRWGGQERTPQRRWGPPSPKPCQDGRRDSPCDPSCPGDRRFLGDHVHPRREREVVMEMLGGCCPHTPLPLSPRGAGSWCHVLALPPGRPRWGCPLLCPLVGSSSPGGRGDHALQDGQAFQLHPEEKDSRLVARPQARQLLLTWGAGRATRPQIEGGRPHPRATYIISVLARGAGWTTGTHGTLGETQDEDAVGDGCPLSPCRPSWAVPGSGSPIPTAPG